MKRSAKHFCAEIVEEVQGQGNDGRRTDDVTNVKWRDIALDLRVA